MNEESTKEGWPPDSERCSPTKEIVTVIQGIGDGVTTSYEPEEPDNWFLKLIKHGISGQDDSVQTTKGKGKFKSQQTGELERINEPTPEEAQRINSINLTDSQKALKEASAKNKTPLLVDNHTVQPYQGLDNHTVCQRFLSDFKDIEKIGSGGFGTVFKAKCLSDDKVYAIKRVKLTNNMEKDLLEVKFLTVLKHDNILHYYGHWIGEDISYLEDESGSERLTEAGTSNWSSPRHTDSNCQPSDQQAQRFNHCTTASPCSEQETLIQHLFIQTEFCEQGTLRDWINQRERVGNYKDNSSIKFQQIVEGVKYMHLKDIFHRDLKPANIFITAEDKVKIGDFGLATSGTDDLARERTTDKGTPSYMAPEQEKKKYGKEVDLYSLGLVWFEMLQPFKTETEKSFVWKKIRSGMLPLEFINKFPKEATIIKKLLSQDPSKRLSIATLQELLNKDESELTIISTLR